MLIAKLLLDNIIFSYVIALIFYIVKPLIWLGPGKKCTHFFYWWIN